MRWKLFLKRLFFQSKIGGIVIFLLKRYQVELEGVKRSLQVPLQPLTAIGRVLAETGQEAGRA